VVECTWLSVCGWRVEGVVSHLPAAQHCATRVGALHRALFARTRVHGAAPKGRVRAPALGARGSKCNCRGRTIQGFRGLRTRG
jgi:hypothetical protein